MFDIKKKSPSMAIAIFYAAIPMMLFSVFWMKWFVGVPLCALTIFSCARISLEPARSWSPEWNRENLIRAAVMLFIIFAWVFYSGIGGMTFQNDDHPVRNGIFNLLVERDWPVISNGWALIYYIGFWLPAAIVGKAFGLLAGYLFQLLWAVAGTAVTYYFMCKYWKRFSVWLLLAFIFFSGLDIVGSWLTQSYAEDFGALHTHIEWWAGAYQFSSFTTQLFWVYNQSVYGLLLTILIMTQNSNRNILFIWSFGILCSTFQFAGLFPFVVYKVICNSPARLDANEKARAKNLPLFFAGTIKSALSAQNITGILIMLVSLLYILPNSSANNRSIIGAADQQMQSVELDKSERTEQDEALTEEIEQTEALASWRAEEGAQETKIKEYKNSMYDLKKFSSRGFSRQEISRYIIFIILEFGLWFGAIYMGERRRAALFYLTLATLLFCPLIKVGYGADFCMRASIPALLILFLMCAETWNKARAEKNAKVVLLMSVLFFLGAVTPFHEFVRTMSNEQTPALPVSGESLLQGGNFSGETKGSIFFERIAR